MAILIVGKTTCCLCGRAIADCGDAVGFPAFLGPRHPLHRFSDSTFHAACFATWPDREKFAAVYERYRAVIAKRPKDMRDPAKIDEWLNREKEELREELGLD